jgi:hypothetical protein
MPYTIEIDDELEDWEWADAKDELVLAFETLGDTLSVEASNLGWTHATASGIVESHMAWKNLTINGEYRLVAEIDDDVITVARYSHDEPTGATFKFTKAKESANV